MTQHRRQHQNENDMSVYCAAVLRGTVSGTVRALIAWLLEL
jgi:hypothetical protein